MGLNGGGGGRVGNGVIGEGEVVLWVGGLPTHLIFF